MGQIILVSVFMLGTLIGCAGRTTSRAVATDIPVEQARPAYWLDQPAVAQTRSADYDRLFAACEHVLRQRRFDVDRRDYRSGLITSRPLISQQIWEPWRSDVGSLKQMQHSSLATYRRTVRWTIAPEGAGFVAVPKVVVERFSDESRRVTAATQYRGVLSPAEAQSQLASPKLEQVPANKWYATGRDEPLERELARHVETQLQSN